MKNLGRASLVLAFVFGRLTYASPPDPLPRGVLDVKDFGAIGDGKADDTAGLQRAIDATLKAGGGLHVPRGIYLVMRPVEIAPKSYAPEHALILESEWATLRAGKPMDTVLHVEGPTTLLSIHRLILDGNGKARHGFTAFKISGRQALVEQVHVTNATSNGFDLDACQGSVFRSCSASQNAGDGWRCTDCNAAVLDADMAMDNKGNGFTFAAKNMSGGATLSAFWSERNGGHGVEVTERVLSPMYLRDGWIEGNGGDGVKVAAVDAVLSGLGVTGLGKGGNRAIRLTATATATHVSGCYVQRGGGDDSYAQIRVEGPPGSGFLEGNFHRQVGGALQPEFVTSLGTRLPVPAAPGIPGGGADQPSAR